MKKIILIIITLTSIAFSQNSKKFVYYLSGDSYQAETLEYKRLIDSVSGSISSADLNAIDVFVKETSSIRSKIIRFNPFGGDNLTTALVPLFRGTATGQVIGNAIDANVNFVSGDYSRTGGLGDASNSSKYLQTGYNQLNATFDKTKFAWGVFSLTNTTTASYDMGFSSDWRINCRTGSGYAYMRASYEYTATNSSSLGFHFWQVNTNKIQFWKNGSFVAESGAVTIGNPINITLRIFRESSTATYTPRKLSGYIILKENLTTDENMLLYNAWNKLKTAFGR